MSNADKPAFPTPFYRDTAGNHHGGKPGLTKLEELAARNMAALLSNPAVNNSDGYVTYAQMVAASIRTAKDLLKQLEQADN